MQNNINFVYIFLLFFICVPGIVVLVSSRKMSHTVTALVHAAIFATILYVTSFIFQFFQFFQFRPQYLGKNGGRTMENYIASGETDAGACVFPTTCNTVNDSNICCLAYAAYNPQYTFQWDSVNNQCACTTCTTYNMPTAWAGEVGELPPPPAVPTSCPVCPSAV